MAITRYLVFIVFLFSATYAAATFDAKMKGDTPPVLRIAYLPSLSIEKIDVSQFMQQVGLYLEQLRLDEFLRMALEKVHPLTGEGRRVTQ